jgi:hypothetical protein
LPNYYVAKSYQEWEKIGDVYESNGRMYLKVKNPKGAEKEVLAYSETEYRRLYKEAPCGQGAQPSVKVKAPAGPIVKGVLGFEHGYIYIFKGDFDRAEYWFEKTPECRFHVIFGWYIVSTEFVPFDIPSCIESIQLPWEKVGNADGTLLPKGIVEAAVNELRYGGHPSQYQGHIGDRMELKLWVSRIIDLGETQYGTKQLYLFQDENSNEYTWNTGVKKNWLVGDEVHAKATVKAHDTYQGIRQTALTRLMEVKK